MTPCQPRPTPDTAVAPESAELALALRSIEQACVEINEAHIALVGIHALCRRTLEQVDRQIMTERRRTIVALTAIGTIADEAHRVLTYRPEIRG